MALFDTYNDKVLARRAARARRSRWLSKIVFFTTSLCIMITLRTQPEAVAQVVTWVQQHSQRSDVATDLSLPQVRSMPLDKVTVNRGGTAKETPVFTYDTKAQAEAVSAALAQMSFSN